MAGAWDGDFRRLLRPTPFLADCGVGCFSLRRALWPTGHCQKGGDFMCERAIVALFICGATTGIAQAGTENFYSQRCFNDVCEWHFDYSRVSPPRKLEAPARSQAPRPAPQQPTLTPPPVSPPAVALEPSRAPPIAI